MAARCDRHVVCPGRRCAALQSGDARHVGLGRSARFISQPQSGKPGSPPQPAMNNLIPIAALFFAAQTPVFRTDVKLVEVYATVFDGGGRAVGGLAREQFEIRDDGAAQAIRVFETTDKT